MTTYRIVIRVTTTKDFAFEVEANTREEARGKLLSLFDSESPNFLRQNTETKFVSTKVVNASTNPPNKGD